MSVAIQGKAYSKVNLFLNIIGRSKNNYHLIESLIVFADLYDDIQIAKANEFNISYINNNDIVVGADTISRAVEKLSSYLDYNFNVAIKVKKNIPIGAGFGGGSADAALVLRMLIKFYKLNISNNILYKIAESIGCDVPVCLKNYSCLVRGVGEILLSVPYFCNIPAIFINPMKFISSGNVFKNYTGNFSASIALNRKSIMKNFSVFKNDLYKVVVFLVPEIEDIVNAIKIQDGCKFSAMSGSGASCFGLFTNIALRNKAYRSLKIMFSNYFMCCVNITHKGDTDFIYTHS